MDTFDQFVEKVVLHNKLLSAAQIQAAILGRKSDDGASLLEILLRAGLLRKEHAEQIQAAFHKTPRPTSSQGANAPVPGATADPPHRTEASPAIQNLLATARGNGVSDVHLIVGSPPMVRKFGTLQDFDGTSLTASDTENLLFSLLDADQRELLKKNRYLDTSLVLQGERYRMCILKQKNGYDGSFRLIRKSVATPKSLGLPENVLTQLTDYHQGLILVTGPSGCGKSTTVAAMLEMINQKRACHIITLEDPIENVFTPVKAHFSQRQLMDHTTSFSAALRAALREDPDVIMIGELRDYETASLAVTASETGHLVISTLHTTSAVRTVTRLLDMFPADQKSQVQMMISESLRGIVAQKLIPNENNTGMALATEILINNSAIGSLIRKGQFIQIPSAIQTGGNQGMRSMDSSVNELLRAGTISGIEAYFASENQAPHQKFAPKDE